MTARPICQWCRQPTQGPPTWWDGKPQCPDPIQCARRIPRTDSR